MRATVAVHEHEGVELDAEAQRRFALDARLAEGDGGRTLVDVRSGKQLEVSDNSFVDVKGENFAPLPRLACVYRRTGECIFDTFESAVPAVFSSSTPSFAVASAARTRARW